MKPTADSTEVGTVLMAADRYMTSGRQAPALPPLAPGELERARELAASLVPTEERLGDIVKFGGEVQSALAEISKAMLAGVRVKALDEVMDLSEAVLSQVRVLDLDELVPTARRTLFVLKESAAAIRQRIARFFRGYELVSRRLDRHEAELFRKEAEAARRFQAYAELERVTRKLMRDARVGVAALELFLDGEHGQTELERRQRSVAEERAAAERENRSIDFVILTAAERYGKYVERVEMKRTSLQRVVLSAYQSEIAIRLVQDNENVIRQKLSDVRTDLLPQWRTRIALAYNAYVQQGMAAFVKGLERAEAELHVKTADQIAHSAESAADLLTTQVFDPAAMKYYQGKLISALETLKTASSEARRIREAADEAMQRSIDELGAAAAAISAGR